MVSDVGMFEMWPVQKGIMDNIISLPGKVIDATVIRIKETMLLLML